MRLVLIKFWRQRLEIMLFNSIAFICVFLPVIFILYYLLPGKIKDIALVAGGAVFFAWGAPVNLVVLAFFILFNYAVGIQMEGYMRRRRSTEQLFAGSILINIIVYVFFAFIGQRVGFISEVPVGIGICILQVLSYLIEIHRGNVKAQKSILDFAVYIAMSADPKGIKDSQIVLGKGWRRNYFICMWFCKESYHCRLPGRFIYQDHVFEGRRVVCVWCMAGMCNLHVPDLLCVQWIL